MIFVQPPKSEPKTAGSRKASRNGPQVTNQLTDLTYTEKNIGIFIGHLFLRTFAERIIFPLPIQTLLSSGPFQASLTSC